MAGIGEQRERAGVEAAQHLGDGVVRDQYEHEAEAAHVAQAGAHGRIGVVVPVRGPVVGMVVAFVTVVAVTMVMAVVVVPVEVQEGHGGNEARR